MIDLSQLRKEQDALRARRRELERAAGLIASGAQAAELAEIDERLLLIADELIGPCIVV